MYYKQLQNISSIALILILILGSFSTDIYAQKVKVAAKGKPFLRSKPDTIITVIDAETQTEEWHITNNKKQIVALGTCIEGKKAGIWTSLHQPDSLIATLTEYREDKKNGLFLQLNNKCQLEVEAHYVDDQLEGKKRSFEKGKISEIAHYKNGKLHGRSASFSNKGKLQEEHFYVAGKRNGTSKWFYEDGSLVTQYNYKAGKIEGIVRGYYANGSIKSEIHFENNEKNGPYKSFYNNKVIKKEGDYKNNEKEGPWKSYDDKGNVTKSQTYKAGKLTE